MVTGSPLDLSLDGLHLVLSGSRWQSDLNVPWPRGAVLVVNTIATMGIISWGLGERMGGAATKEQVKEVGLEVGIYYGVGIAGIEYGVAEILIFGRSWIALYVCLYKCLSLPPRTTYIGLPGWALIVLPDAHNGVPLTPFVHR